MRFLLRLIGYILIAAGFVSLVVDGARSIANSTLIFTPLSEPLMAILRERYAQIQPAVERNIHPLLWDPVLLTVTTAPAALVAFVIGFVLLRLGARRDPVVGIVTRR